MAGKDDNRASSLRKLIPLSARASIGAVPQDEDRGRDFYHRVLNLSWASFSLLAISIYAAFNVLFAWLYLALGGVAHLETFSDGLFFSLATMVTLNFGTMFPQTLATNIAVAVEALSGYLSFAVLGALTFARLSRPTARVLFSRTAVVGRYKGIPTLMFRAANRRGNQIIQAEAQVALVRNEAIGDGVEMRRIHDLRLLRNRHPVFALSWTLMHPLDEDSPLWGYSPESLAANEDFIIVVVSGTDDTFNQTIHARCLYNPQDIRWNHRFADILVRTDKGVTMDFTRFHDTVPLLTLVSSAEPSAGVSGGSAEPRP